MRPTQVLDLHADLLARWRDIRFASIARNWFMVDLDASALPDSTTYKLLAANAQYMYDVIYHHLLAGYDYRVTEDMCALVQHAANMLNDEDEWRRAYAPTGAGIVRFDVPLLLKDMQGREMKVHWLTWGPAAAERSEGEHAPVTLMTFWNDAEDPDESSDEYILPESRELARRIQGRWRWVAATYTEDGRPLGPSTVEIDEERKVEEHLIKGVEPTPYSNAIRFVHALWMLLNQSITEIDTELPDRAGRRRADKARIPPRVSVIRLRRTEGASRAEGESSVDWQHRWVTRGHWRWQACRNSYPGAVEREPDKWRARIWIAPHLNLATREDLPLIRSDKLYNLER